MSSGSYTVMHSVEPRNLAAAVASRAVGGRGLQIGVSLPSGHCACMDFVDRRLAVYHRLGRKSFGGLGEHHCRWRSETAEDQAPHDADCVEETLKRCWREKADLGC